MAQDREAGENRRSEFLEKKPVADDVLDVVRHHGQHGCDKVAAKIPVMERCEGDLLFGAERFVLTEWLRG